MSRLYLPATSMLTALALSLSVPPTLAQDYDDEGNNQSSQQSNQNENNRNSYNNDDRSRANSDNEQSWNDRNQQSWNDRNQYDRSQYDRNQYDRSQTQQQRNRENFDRSQSRDQDQRRIDLDRDDAAIGVSLSDSQNQDGARVLFVHPGSPAQKAGLRRGDHITSVDGERIRSSRDVMNKIRRMDPNSDVEISIDRQGRNRTLDVQLETREEALIRGRASGQDQGYGSRNYDDRNSARYGDRTSQWDRGGQSSWNDGSQNYSNRQYGSDNRTGTYRTNYGQESQYDSPNRNQDTRMGDRNWQGDSQYRDQQMRDRNTNETVRRLEQQVREMNRELNELRERVRNMDTNRSDERNRSNSNRRDSENRNRDNDND